jgi:hypothetical protein
MGRVNLADPPGEVGLVACPACQGSVTTGEDASQDRGRGGTLRSRAAALLRFPITVKTDGSPLSLELSGPPAIPRVHLRSARFVSTKILCPTATNGCVPDLFTMTNRERPARPCSPRRSCPSPIYRPLRESQTHGALTRGANARRPDAILTRDWVEAADRDGVSGDSNRLRLLVNSLSEIGPRRKESHLHPREFRPNSTASNFDGSLPVGGEPCGGARDPGQDTHQQAGVEASGANLQTLTARLPLA